MDDRTLIICAATLVVGLALAHPLGANVAPGDPQVASISAPAVYSGASDVKIPAARWDRIVELSSRFVSK